MEVEPGDTLYLPRGWLHQALTSDEDSLHLTVGVNVVTWLDALRAALDRLRGRRRLPAGARPPTARARRSSSSAWPPHLEPDDVLAAARRRLAGRRRPILDGQLSELRALDTLVGRHACWNAGPPSCTSSSTETTAGSASPGRDERSGFRRTRAGEVESLAAAHGPFSASELDGGLDEAGRLVLVRRLVREGFLRRARVASDGDD